MWIESRVTSWPLMFRRQFAQPIDVDSVFETLAEMEAYLTNTLRHIGQIATCQETEGIIYIMNNNKDAWVTIKTDGGTIIFDTITELNNYLSNIDRKAGEIATCLETEGFIYILNNLKDNWIIIGNSNSLIFTSITELNNYLSDIDRKAGEIATCLENSGVIYILNNSKDAWISIDINLKLNISDFNTHTALTNAHSVSFDNLITTAHTHVISDTTGLTNELNLKTNNISFNSHTADTSIHFTKNSINLNDLSNTAHTHNYLPLNGGNLTGNLTAVTYYGDGSQLTGIVTEIGFGDLINTAHTHIIADTSGLQTSLDSKANLTSLNSHTVDTSIHFTKNSINLNELSNTAHTHAISDTTNLQTSLDSKANLTSLNAHTADTSIHFTKNSINLNELSNTAHTHTIANVTNLQTSLDGKLNLTGGTLTGNLTAVTYYGDGSQLTGIVTEIDFGDLITTAHTHAISDTTGLQTSLDSKTPLTSFNAHTADTSVHFTKNSINLSDISNTAHTHSITDTTGLQTNLDLKANLTSLNSHTADTSIHFTKNSINLNDISNTAHTHIISDTTGLQTSLDSKANLTSLNAHTADTSIHFTKSEINLSDISNTAHTHSIANVTNLQTNLDLKTNLTLFNNHTATTNAHEVTFNNLVSTAHTHIIADVTNLQTSLDSKLNLTGGTLSGNLTGTTIAASTLSASTYIGVDTTEVLNLSTLSGTTLTDVLNTATVATDGLTLNNTDIILGLREELVGGVNKQVNKFWQGNLFTKQKMFIAYDRTTPSASDDFVIFVPDVNITITKVYFVTKATTVAFNINHSSNVDIWTSDKTATITTQLSDVINNPNCLAGMPIKYQASAIGTTPLNIHMTIYYTED